MEGVVMLYVGVCVYVYVWSDGGTDVLSVCACMCTHAQDKDVWECAA